MYVAAVTFADLQDDKRLYNAGDEFPRKGLIVSKERIAELAGSNNRMGYALIKQVAESTEKPVKAVENSDEGFIRQASKAAKKPRRKRENNADTDL